MERRVTSLILDEALTFLVILRVVQESLSLVDFLQWAIAHAYKRSAFGAVACRLIVKRSIVSHYKSTSPYASGCHFAFREFRCD
ncbi:MAG: hypothetical protein ACI87E_001517 [Mariniblastus sp.]|jgi:hypothetical protein